MDIQIDIVKTIVVTWDAGKLIAWCDDEDQTLASPVDWEDPITVKTDAWAVAHAITQITKTRILAIDHDKEFIFIIGY